MKKLFWGAGFILAALLLTGCPTGNDVVLSDNANLESLEVGGYALDSSFAAATTSYKAFVDGTMSSVNLTARLADSDASLAWSVADPTAAALAYGKNSFTVTVTAEDGETKKTYSLEVWRCNAYGNTIDSVGGSYLSQTVSYSVYSGATLVYSVDNGSSKDQPLYFASGTAYKVVAAADGRAASSKDNFSYADGDGEITLVCQKLEQSTFPAEAPSIVHFSYTTQALNINSIDSLQGAGVAWTEFAEGADVDVDTMTIVRAVVTAKSEMDITSWAGQGIMFGIDELPGFFGGYYPQNTDSDYSATTGMFTAEAYISLAGLNIENGDHTLSLVVYDRSGNRSQRDVQVNAINGIGTTGKDLSTGYYIDGLRVVSRTYGVSRQYYSKRLGTDALDPGASGPATCRVTLNFGFYDAADADETILGFRVYRSEDGGASFDWIGSVNYGGYRAGWSGDGNHVYYDLDPDLEAGTCYVYKVTVFSDSNAAHDFSDISAPVVVTSPYTISLNSPADGAVVTGGEVPTLKFSLSDTTMWDPDKSAGFCFAPAIREKTGETLFFGEFEYYFEDRMLYYWDYANDTWTAVAGHPDDLSDYFTYNPKTGQITLKPALLAGKHNFYSSSDAVLAPGVTYEWNIFGAWTGSNYDPGNGVSVSPPYFYGSWNAYSYDAGGWFNSYSYSYADSYEDGMDAVNGWFELVAGAAAE